MKNFFAWLFSENNSTNTITLFSIWHFLYLLIIIGGSITIACLLKNKSDKAKDITLKIFAYLTIGLYVADFFIMPLSDSYNGISAYKLPFNICTIMAVFVPFAQFNKKFEVVKSSIVMLSITSSLMWMVYPGSALGGQPPFCYLIFQTFMYHGMLFAWAFLQICFKTTKISIKYVWKDIIGVLLILIWAWFGNTIYDKGYNWFFIETSIFPFLPDSIMPLMSVLSVISVCLIIYGIYYAFNKIISLIVNKKNKNTAPETEKTT